jgi:thiol-disulfide isomerase/thioredoxin
VRSRSSLFIAAILLFFFGGTTTAAELKPWTGGATPPLALQDLAGRRHDLADYRGKVVLVNFWATWCEPCRAEMPSIDRLRRSLQGKPFEVLGVNLAEPLSRIEKYLEDMPLSFPLLRDRDSAASKAWKARMLPASYLVGRDGRIRYFAYGELDWTSEPVRKKVSELLQ